MSEHTPGPWKIAEDGHYFGDSESTRAPLFVIQTDSRQIARTTLPADNQEKANARLIAAAPDLLTAIVDLHEICGHWDIKETTIMNRVKAAIAKATE